MVLVQGRPLVFYESYVKKATKGDGIVFSMADGYSTQPNCILVLNVVGRKGNEIRLTKSYQFNWEELNGWYFLEIIVA